MKQKVLNGLVVLSSLFGYLEWGDGNSSFLFRAEWEVLAKLFSDPLEALHPFTVLPLIGQVMLVLTLFQKRPSRLLTLLGVAFLFLLLGLVCFIGIISLNLKIFASTIPFLTFSGIAVFTLLRSRKMRENHRDGQP
ncbi:MAG: hypothetical protein KF756_02480 [Acidobacteria bacterium]|nr:hypothetical protein [Acidobacteriota bacterium]